MKHTLLTCLLALAVIAPGQARAGLSWVATGSSQNQLAEVHCARPAGETLPAQDTSRFGSGREARVAIAGLPARASRPRTASPPAAPADTTPPAYLDEAGAFNPEAVALPADLAIKLRRPATPLGRPTYRMRLVRTGRFATRRESVEILTCTYAGPLVLAQLPAAENAPAQLLAGPGYDQTAALRPLVLTQETVLHLCGDHAPQVLAYARLYNLHFQQADEVARLLDYYNRIAVAVSE